MKILVAQIVGVGPNINSLMLDTLQSVMEENPSATVYHLSCSKTYSICNGNMKSNPAICYRCVKALEKGRKLISGNFTPITIDDILLKRDIEIADQFVDDLREINKNILFENYKAGESSISTYISATRDRDLYDIEESAVRKYMKNGIALYLGLKRFFDVENIDIAYNFNGRHAYQRAVMSAADFFDKKCINMEMARHGGFLESFENSLPQSIKTKQDIIQNIWDNSSHSDTEREKIAKSFFDKKVKGEEVHGGVFIQNQQKNFLPEEIDYTKKNYVLYTSSDDEFAAVGDEWKNPYFEDQNEGIFYVAEFFSKHLKDFNLIIRVHPNMGEVGYSYAKKPLELKDKYSNVFVFSPKSKVDSYALMNIADTVIVFGSSIAVEANYWQKPVILLAKTFYSGMGIAYEPESKKDIPALLQNNLKPKARELSLLFGYYFLQGGEKAKYFHRDENGNVYFKNKQLSDLNIFEKFQSKIIQKFAELT